MMRLPSRSAPLILFVLILWGTPFSLTQTPAPPTSRLYDIAAPGLVRIETDTARGAGFTVSPTGSLVTALSLIADVARVEVETARGEIFDRVRLIDGDARRNVAVLELIPSGSRSGLRLGDSDSVGPGDVVTIVRVSEGTSGFLPSISEGLVRNVGVAEQGFVAFEVDVALVEVDLGSPVVSARGEVVGVVIAIDPGAGRAWILPSNSLRSLVLQ